MCNLQAKSWFLHSVLQVCNLFSYNVCFESRILHGGKCLWLIVGNHYSTEYFNLLAHASVLEKNLTSVSGL